MLNFGAKQQAKNAQSWPHFFSALTSSVKRALVLILGDFLVLTFDFVPNLKGKGK
jgi:hypothetical protein